MVLDCSSTVAWPASVQGPDDALPGRVYQANIVKELQDALVWFSS